MAAAKYKNGHQYRLDGLSVEYDDWHFNVRPSNTEPLLRLNLLAQSAADVEQHTEEVVGVMKGDT